MNYSKLLNSSRSKTVIWRESMMATWTLDSAIHPFLETMSMKFMMARSQYDFVVDYLLFHANCF